VSFDKKLGLEKLGLRVEPSASDTDVLDRMTSHEAPVNQSVVPALPLANRGAHRLTASSST
jgi:hypothetical protein